MSKILIRVEGQLLFEFEKAAWSAIKWDEEVSYLGGLQQHGAKAVDILATQHLNHIYMIEVKDPRGYWVEYRDQNPTEKLAEIFAGKVRDTISAIVYARDRHPGEHLLVHLKSLFQARAAKPVAVLWLEGIEVDPCARHQPHCADRSQAELAQAQGPRHQPQAVGRVCRSTRQQLGGSALARIAT